MHKPLVSVVMPTYNRKTYLREAIKSILDQTFKDFELIIVDDGSSDGSLEIIQEFQKQDPRIILIQNDKPGGISKATNMGIRKSRGKYIAKMDSDDVSLPDRLANQVNFMEKHKDIAACGSWVETIGEIGGSVWQYPTDPNEIRCTMLFCGAIANPTNIVRRSVFFDLGFWYDERCFAAEDYEFWTRIVKKVKLANVPKVLLLYRLHYVNAHALSNQEVFKNTNKVRLNQIKLLGIEPTKEDLNIHQKISDGQLIITKNYLEKINQWCDKLLEANKRKKTFPEPYFSKVVNQKKQDAINVCKYHLGRPPIRQFIIRFVTFVGRTLRLVLPGRTVDKIFSFILFFPRMAIYLYQEFCYFIVIPISKTEKYQIMLGIKKRLVREVPKKFKIGMAVLAYERPEYLKMCLDSLFKTNLHDYDITFLISDDGSKNPAVRKIINQKYDPKYKIIRNFTPKGPNNAGAAINKAMRKLLLINEFDIIGWCDSDCLFHPEWLDKTMKISLWAKKNHQNHVLGPFSSFNSSNYDFHRILGTYKSPYGNYVVKRQMGMLNYFYFKEDFLKLGFFQENKNDETLMTRKFERLGVRNFCTETSYVEHIGQNSVLNQWRPVPVPRAAFGMNLEKSDWGFNMEKISPYGFYKFIKKNNGFMPGKEVKSNMKLDIIIPAIKKDLNILPLTIASVRKFLRHHLGKIYIIGPQDDSVVNFCKINNCVFKEENSVSPITLNEIRKYNYKVKGHDRSGWIFQQLIKLNSDNICDSSNIYVIDADTILVHPQKFESGGKSILLVSDEYYFPYYQTYKKIFNRETSARFSFIAHQMLFKADKLRELRSEMENIHNDSWYKVILNNLDLKELSSFSEYETYGNWMMQKYPDEIELEYWFNQSMRGELSKRFRLNPKKFSNKLRAVSFHSYKKNLKERIINQIKSKFF
jgi:glycosyltransferase involved in cell wall biosynthesis